MLCLLAALGVQVVAQPTLAAMAGRLGLRHAAQAPAPAAPQGVLAPSGCAADTPAAGEVTCELWAKTGTTSILGQSMPIWGYASAAGDPATAPGPVLVVTSGELVHVVLHNQLSQATALAFPSQAATSFVGGSTGGLTSGITNGAQTTYTFTASRPGTFLYEAGHTPNGARQVALGMAGALVVLPANGIGAYGTVPSSYDDEAVLVLSEIDPALNRSANPATFDLRQFDARYRLINGKVFPSTDPVATGVNRTVLLRYVNVGALQHPMELLGGAQVRLAQDGHPADHPTTSLVADLAPGSTMDTLVTMPSGGGAKLSLFEAGGHLNNNGMTEADPNLVASGGMMTFLDTAAPPPTQDVVGPVPARLTISPSPSDGTVPVVVTADVSDATTGGGHVQAAELVVDDAVTQAPGFGLPMTGTFGSTSVHVTGTIPVGTGNDAAYCAANPITLSCLSAGKHRVFVRGLDDAGMGNWGVISDVLLNLPKVGPLTRNGAVTPDPANGQGGVDLEATGDDSGAGGTINQAEWSLDTLASAGSGTAMNVNNGGTIAAVTAHIPQSVLTGLGDGTHHFFVRVHDSLGLWGPELDIPFTLDTSGPTVVAADVAPNPTNGKLDDPGNPGNLVVSAVIGDTAGGIVAGAEGFLDPGASPAPGSGFKLIATDGKYDTSSESVYGLIPLSAITSLTEGNHRVVVRGRDGAGNWGATYTAPLVVDRTSPTLGALTATPNPTNGATTVAVSGTVSEPNLNAAEVWYGTTDPGVGLGTPATISVAPAGTGYRATITVTVPPLTVGTRIVNVRVQDKAGNWSNARATMITIRGGAPAGTAAALLGFGTNVGNVTVSTQAGIPPILGNTGMRAAPAANAPAYVGMDSAVPARSFQAAFAINRNTLRTALNGTITLFDGRTSAATGNGVFAVQMRTTSNGSPGTAQIRAVLTRSNGTTAIGNWFNLPTGGHLVTLQWVSGPATGTAAGRLRVTLDATVLINQTADTSSRLLSRVRLGAIESSAPASLSGVLYVDDYTATGVQ